MEIHIFSHLIAHLQALHLSRSLLSIMTVIAQSHFIAMTLKISISLDVPAVFASPTCLEGKLLLEPQHRSQSQNSDCVMTRHGKKPSPKSIKALGMVTRYSKSRTGCTSRSKPLMHSRIPKVEAEQSRALRPFWNEEHPMWLRL